MGDMLRIKICDCVRKANSFSLLTDESKDESKKEKLAIIVRYVDDKANVDERFLTFVDATSLTAERLITNLISTLNKHGLDHACIVSQGYDGVAVMSGNCHDVQQRMKEIYPYAMYIHCYAHKLNLVLVDCAKKIQFACDLFLLLEALYVFISSSKAHTIFVSMQKELHPEKQDVSYPSYQIQDGPAGKLLLMRLAALMIRGLLPWKKFLVE
ncbi:Zinc finger MYM-type protein 1-like [Oopsacas minuta]|uniref:Zinc finger MYM-type protein 1-like n=1 Tax=Oopsacas minuta TaxID=111878 RepID=A0AAV7KEL4_9METZ|nr:Zinc finger MYM-type protein 1-like [Oopsacas minuta]